MLVRWNPYREMNRMRRMVDRVYDENLAQRWAAAEAAAEEATSPLALDVKETDETYVVKATLPGIDPQDVDITYNDKTLTIQGELKGEEEHENERYHMRERYSGKFYRQLRLPELVQEDAIQASYENGVLTLTLPKSEEVKPKKIVVQTA